MTERLYYTDAYLTDVRRGRRRPCGGRPTGSTSTARRSTRLPAASRSTPAGSATCRVVDVVDEGDRIAHLPRPAGDRPDRCEGAVDWARRFDHMQQHTGQHLLSAVLAELFGHETVSVHFGRESSTLDLDTPGLAHAAGRRKPSGAPTECVTENRPVEVSFEDAASAEGLRKAIRPGGHAPHRHDRRARPERLRRHPRAGNRRDRRDSDPEGRAGEAARPAGVSLRGSRGAPRAGRRRPARRSRGPPVRGAGGAACACSRRSGGAGGRRGDSGASSRRRSPATERASCTRRAHEARARHVS